MQVDEHSPDPQPRPEHEPQPQKRGRFAVVGVGASAGGLEALEGLLRELTPDSGAAVVIVLHLDPTQPSMLSQILSRSARVPVREVKDRVIIEPNAVYVIPSNASLSFEGRELRLNALAEPRYTSIDRFFVSLADEHGEAAVGVVLSGAGSDGAAGLRTVKERGGVTMAQAPEEARNDSMPRAAISLGSVDWVVPVREMPARIAAYAQRLAAIDDGRVAASISPEQAAEQLRSICALVLRRTGHDFGPYKHATVLRRVQRRMRVVTAETLSAYVDELRRTPTEIDRLFSDLLIGVTQFFRDPAVFAALAADVLPNMLRGRGADAQVRAWVPACATGEEAYSLAILVSEAMARHDGAPLVKIFATDIDESALQFARQGRYPESIVEHVSAERLERFFHKQGSGYQVSRDLRDLCVFSTHNIVSDPPFSRLDLISCRNLLIYLDGTIQKKLVPLFHYALAPGGHLVLGPSENLAAHPELFRFVDKDTRLFQKLDAALPMAAYFPLVGARRLDGSGSELLAPPPRSRDSEPGVMKSLERLLFEEFAPPTVVVNDEGKILYTSGATGRFLQLPPVVTRTHVVDMVHPMLRASLHATLHKAIKSGREAIHEDLPFESDGVPRRLDLIARPMPDTGGAGLFMVIFRETARPMQLDSHVSAAENDHGELAAQFERELRSTREHLQTTIAEHETSAEELQSANEELLSTNEELQSANEELQTSKEELQSINEELSTVNVELLRKVEELDRANGDLTNLFASTDIATMFLDGQLRIKKFSPAAKELFRVIDVDVGRPLTDLATTFTDGDLVSAVRDVLATLALHEQEVHRPEGDRWYIRRIRPYRSLDNVIDGVVITFVDVTDLKHAQERIAALAAIVDSSQDAIIGQTLDGAITSWNAGAERMYGYSVREAVGMELGALFHADENAAFSAARARARRGEHVEVEDVVGRRKDGSHVDLLLTLSPVHGAHREVVALSAITHDVTERRRAELALRRSEERFRRLSESGVLGIAFFDQAGSVTEANDAFLTTVGHGRGDLARGAVLLDRLTPPEASDRMATFLAELWRTGSSAPYEAECVRRNGSRLFCLLGGARLDNGTEGVVFLLDVTERRRAAEELRQSEERLRLALEATTLGTSDFDPVTGAMSGSPRAKALWALAPDDAVTYEIFLSRLHPDDRRAVDEALRRALDPGGSGEYRILYRVLAPDGSTRWIDASGRAFFSNTGGFRRPVRLSSALLDITERKQIEEALREADRRKDRFLAVLAHELRNPLAPIRNAVQVMRRTGAADPSLVRIRDIIDRQVRHMTHLLDDLLDVSRVSSGKITLRHAVIDLVELVRAVLDERRSEAESEALSLSASLPDQPLWVRGDPTRLAQSVANLLINAIKFTDRGGRIAVRVALEPGGTMASVSVQDTGMGLEPEMMTRLFEPFAQADRSLGRSRGGLGLGLSLVKAFMELHGGSVDVASDGPGLGSLFTLRLPLAAEAPAAALEPVALASAQRVLVIEDNVDSAESMMMLLELAGHEVALAYDGPAGIETARSFRPTVVLCDIGLPGDMDGYAVARALRADPELRTTRLIALTGYGQEEDKLRAREAGFDEHLTKPIDPDSLDRVLAAGTSH